MSCLPLQQRSGPWLQLTASVNSPQVPQHNTTLQHRSSAGFLKLLLSGTRLAVLLVLLFVLTAIVVDL